MPMHEDEKRIHEAIAQLFLDYRAKGIGPNQALQLIYLGMQRADQQYGDGTSILPAPPAAVPEESDAPWTPPDSR